MSEEHATDALMAALAPVLLELRERLSGDVSPADRLAAETAAIKAAVDAANRATLEVTARVAEQLPDTEFEFGNTAEPAPDLWAERYGSGGG